MLQLSLEENDVKNVLVCIRAMWIAGNVKGEDQGAALSALRQKFEDALKPKAEPQKEQK